MTGRIAWIDCGSGASGDMLLGALVAAGVPLEVMASAVAAVAPEDVRLAAHQVTRNGLAATQVTVTGTDSTHHRTWSDVRSLLEAAPLEPAVRASALETFRRLAEAEAKVHGTSPDAIHFHEVGALDAIADVVGVCAGFVHLGLDRVYASPVAVGSGFVRAAHGRLPVPVPAVVELLASAGAPSYGGETPASQENVTLGELCTPTGAALLVTHVSSWGSQPAMRVETQGCGAGSRDIPGRPNVIRLLVGNPAAESRGDRMDGLPTTTQVVVETNVDDLDPRIWPDVLRRLLEAGAVDAWLTPILAKKGRPAHVLGVLVDPDRVQAVCRVIFRETSAIGVRCHDVRKHPLDREMRDVTLTGGSVRVKVASYAGTIVNAQPEYDDVLALAAATGRPIKDVLAEAIAAVRNHLEPNESFVRENG
ncbi:MAG TPA: nickel pincer cofactor biosynthesis protein LarC [Actinopolymorphaceae bacterium]